MDLAGPGRIFEKHAGAAAFDDFHSSPAAVFGGFGIGGTLADSGENPEPGDAGKNGVATDLGGLAARGHDEGRLHGGLDAGKARVTDGVVDGGRVWVHGNDIETATGEFMEGPAGEGARVSRDAHNGDTPAGEEAFDLFASGSLHGAAVPILRLPLNYRTRLGVGRQTRLR